MSPNTGIDSGGQLLGPNPSCGGKVANPVAMAPSMLLGRCTGWQARKPELPATAGMDHAAPKRAPQCGTAAQSEDENHPVENVAC
jgi:hypothetical protein